MYNFARMILISLLLCACGAKNASLNDFYLTGRVKTQLMPLNAVAEPYVSQQKMTATYNDTRYSFIVAMSSSACELSIVLLSDFIRVFTASYDGLAIKYELSALVPQTFPLEYLFYDIQLITYPLEIVQKHLPAGIYAQETESDGVRTRYILNDIDRFVIIEYAGGTVKFTNTERKYSYTIEDI